jgi:CHAD domain-containing protein
VLREMFGQFTGNLYCLVNTNEPEAVHQARIGWRRFKSSMRLFKPALNPQTRPPLNDLQDVLRHLGELRNINVARSDTLPALADLYIGGDVRRAKHWKAMTQSLEHAAQVELANLRAALQAPALGTCLLWMTQWLENLSASNQTDKAVIDLSESLASFAKRRTGRLHRQLQHICQLDGLENAHQLRLLAKRLRYNVESLSALLPKKLRKAEQQQALQLQVRIGAQRDVAQALQLITSLGSAPELLAFMQGYCLGYSHASSASAAAPK